MPTTDAQRRARDKWLSEKVETINLRVPKGSKEIIKTCLLYTSVTVVKWKSAPRTRHE